VDVNNQGYGLYFDAGYNYGSGDVSFLFWLADGSNWDSDSSFHEAIGLGDFGPFTVAFGYNSLGGPGSTRGANREFQSLNEIARENALRVPAAVFGFGIRDVIPPLEQGDNAGSNQWGLGLLGNHHINDDIALNWGIGYFSLVHPYAISIPGLTPQQRSHMNFSKSLGWELDLGVTIQLLDNLTFESQFGYFFNGAAFDRYVATDVNGWAVWEGADNTVKWFNTLNVSF
jgi:hypothetical protein